MDGRHTDKHNQIYGQVDGWTNGRTDGGWNDAWMDKQRTDSDKLKDSRITNQLINRQEDERDILTAGGYADINA